MPLSDINIKNAKPLYKPYKLTDEKGMYVLVHPNGDKYFRLNYRFEGKRQTLALGVYPGLTLAKAREMLYAAKLKLADGINPAEQKSTVKAYKKAKIETRKRNESGVPPKNSFKEIALAWFKGQENKSDRITLQKKLRRFENHIFPSIGNMDIAAIKSPAIYQTIKPLIDRNEIETVHSACGRKSPPYSITP